MGKKRKKKKTVRKKILKLSWYLWESTWPLLLMINGICGYGKAVSACSFNKGNLCFFHLPAFLGYSCCSLLFVTPSFSVSSSRYSDPVIFLPASSESISFWSALFKPYCYSVTLSFKSSFVQPSSTSSWMFWDSAPPPTSIIYTPGSCPISCLCFAMLPIARILILITHVHQ